MSASMLPKVDMASVQRILIIKMSALGDIIHALPVSAALGEAFPHIELTWAVEEAFAPLVMGNPYLTHVLTLPKVRHRQWKSGAFRREYFRCLRDVRNRRFDLTLDLQGLTKSAVVAAASGARTRLGYHWLREAASFLERPIPKQTNSVHIVDQYLDVARFLGAPPESVRFPLDIPAEDEAFAEEMLREAGIAPGTPFVSVNPASARVIKQWGEDRYAALMDAVRDEMGLPSVIVTMDKAVTAKVQSFAKHPFINLTGRTNLKQLAAVLRRSAAHVCGDTGSGHIAAALNTPVVSLIGPTDPERACPYGQRKHTLNHREECDPACNFHHCQFARPRCLDAIHVADVLSHLREILSDVKMSPRETP